MSRILQWCHFCLSSVVLENVNVVIFPFVCEWFSETAYEHGSMKFGGQTDLEPTSSGLSFGGDPDLGLVPSDDYHFIERVSN